MGSYVGIDLQATNSDTDRRLGVRSPMSSKAFGSQRVVSEDCRSSLIRPGGWVSVCLGVRRV